MTKALLVTFEEVLAEVSVGRVELERWIGERWVLPVEQDGQLMFDEVDCARVRLIAELREDLAVNEEALPVILQLLDQVYELRRALGELKGALDTLPEDTRASIDEVIRSRSGS